MCRAQAGWRTAQPDRALESVLLLIRLVSVRSCSRSGIASPAVKRPKAASIDASRGWHTASPILRSDRYSRTERHIARLPRRVAAMSPG
jgi:hypothetical protein